MIITTEKGKQIRGDLIHSATLRTDLSPIPVSFEANIRADGELITQLAEGKLIYVGGDALRIVKTNPLNARLAQGNNPMSGVSLIALLDSCRPVCFVREQAIIKSNTSLLEIYKAAGATLKALESDITIPRFSCFKGDTPTFQIAQCLQEEGGVIRWKNGKMQFFRYADLFKQKPIITIADNDSENVNSEFLERHIVPTFYSTDKDGSIVFGNDNKTRDVRFSPKKNQQQLVNMTRCLIHRKKTRLTMNLQMCAGDIVAINGAKPLVIITAAHVLETGADGNAASQYSKLWLGALSK